MRPNQFHLLSQRRFAPFFWTQFFGALNDNVFKFACTLLVTYQASRYTSSALPLAVLVNVIAGLFILPFLLFSATAGQLADKFERARLIRFTKGLELIIVLLATWGFAHQSLTLLLLCIALLGTQAALFGPVKYAYLPQHLGAQELIGGNALVESGTFIAILLGTLLAGLLMNQGEAATHWVSGVIVVIALVGLACSGFIPRSPAPDPTLNIRWNPVTETWRNLLWAKTRRTVFLSMLGISWLWFFGATLLTQFPALTKQVLGGDATVATALLTLFSLGIGVGALLCERLSDRKIEIGLVPLGSIGMSVFALDLYFATRGGHPSAMLMGFVDFVRDSTHWRMMLDLFLLAMFSGFYSVPLYALIQSRSDAVHRSRIIAANNILNALFMIIAAVMAALCLDVLHFSIPQLFLLLAVLNALVAMYIYGLVPEFLLRFLAWMLAHSIYHLRKEGLQHIPERGAAVLVCNHVSFVDAVVLMGISPRPIRFVMDYAIFKLPGMSWFFRHAKVIPIASAKVDAVMMEAAFAEVSKALRNGDLVCIFPEGKITDHGELNLFRPGISRILKTDPVPVIPMALCGLWGSFFSRRYGPAMTRLRWVYLRIAVHIGVPVAAAEATPGFLQQRVAALRGAWR